MDGVLLPTEVEHYVETITPQEMDEIGTKQWLEWHQRLQKLNQQALLEAAQLRDEHVKETLVLFQKVGVLVYEAILINIWKSKVFPELLQLEPEPANSLVAYSVLYHEAVCVALLEIVTFHENCCETLNDAAIDLLDYAYGASSLLLSLKQEDAKTNETVKKELLRHRQNLSFDIGMRCLTIIRYLCEHMESLPIGICSRVYTTHDIPTIFIRLLQVKPWIKGNKQYSGGKWINWDGEAISQADAQVWLTLRHLLLDPACKTYYSITEARRSQITKLMMLLTPVILDQLSPLIELKQWLSHITIEDQLAAAPKPILIETVLEIKKGIMSKCQGKVRDIAKRQLRLIFCNDKTMLMTTAQMVVIHTQPVKFSRALSVVLRRTRVRSLNEAFNTNLLETLEIKEKAPCEQCNKQAIQRCSHCKKVWYCSRTCQVTHWPVHKEMCSK